MDAPTDIPLKIQLGWRYHAPAARESARTKTTSVHHTAPLQYTGKRWEIITVRMANLSVPAVLKAFIPKTHLLWTGSTFRHHLQVAHFYFLLAVFFGLVSLARSQRGEQCEDHMPSATVGQINSIFRQRTKAKFDLRIFARLTLQIVPSQVYSRSAFRKIKPALSKGIEECQKQGLIQIWQPLCACGH